MLIGMLMLILPIVVYIVSVPFTGRLNKRLRYIYIIGGGVIVFVGSSISIYFAMYTGDQGGIGAYIFQLFVISAFVLFTFCLVTLHWFSKKRKKES